MAAEGPARFVFHRVGNRSSLGLGSASLGETGVHPPARLDWCLVCAHGDGGTLGCESGRPLLGVGHRVRGERQARNEYTRASGGGALY